MFSCFLLSSASSHSLKVVYRLLKLLSHQSIWPWPVANPSRLKQRTICWVHKMGCGNRLEYFYTFRYLEFWWSFQPKLIWSHLWSLTWEYPLRPLRPPQSCPSRKWNLLHSPSWSHSWLALHQSEWTGTRGWRQQYDSGLWRWTSILYLLSQRATI